jgi:hypothetical protein
MCIQSPYRAGFFCVSYPCTIGGVCEVSKRPQVQERMTRQNADAIVNVLDSKGVTVTLDSRLYWGRIYFNYFQVDSE